MEEDKKKASKKKKIMTIVIVLLLLIVIAILGFIIYKLLHKEPEDRGATEGLVSIEEKAEDDASTFTTDMNMIWYFPSGERTSINAKIGNSIENTHPVFFQLYLNDEEQTLLYDSSIIPVGQRLKELKLDKALPDGRHNAVCTFHIMSNDDPNEELSRVSFNVELVFGEE